MRELLNRKYLVSFFYLIVCVIGIAVWRVLPIESTPELNLPSVTVNYNWGSTSPEIMEQEITRKVEREANRLRDVTDIRSVTQEGRSTVTITFRKGAPVDYRVLELREYLFGLDENLPESISPPSISRQVPEELEDQQTFIVYTLNGEMPPRQLLDYARTNIRPKLLALDGLAEVAIRGVQDPALVIEFDIEQVEKYGLSPMQILVQIREQLSWRSAGFTEEGISRYSLIIPPKFENIADIAALKVQLPGAMKQLRVDDIAKVSVQDYPAKTIKRINGDPALTIEFVKESGADAFTLAESILERMEEMEAQLPESLSLMLTVDSTEELREQFDELQLQAIFSGILVFLVVILFIRKIRAPVVIIGSVVFSVLLSVIVLYLLDYSLNIITLAGITIALGMLIDNAVVVFEHLNPGLPSDKSERIGHITNEIGNAVVPVLGSTFTTVGIFVPLLFALDELRIFLVPLAVALTVTLVSSVLIAFTWIPYALVWLTPGGIKPKKKKGKMGRWVKRGLMRSFLLKSKLRWVLPVVLIGVIGIPLFAIEEPEWEAEEDTWWPEFTQVYFNNRDMIDPWIGGLTRKFVTETYFGSPWKGRENEIISVYIRSPQGTPLSEIDKIVQNYEEIVQPYEQAFEFYEANISEYYGARMQFIVKPEYLVQPDPYYFFGEAMYMAARTGNVATSVSGFNDGISTGFGGGSSNHSIQLTGYSYDELLNLAKDLERRLKTNRRVREVDINSSYYFSRDDFQQYILRLKEEKILAKSLDRREVISTLMLDLNPENTVGKVEFGGQEMYLIGRNERGKTFEEDMMNRTRKFGEVNFNMSTIGEVVKEGGLSEIRRDNQSYERVVSVDYLGNYRMGREYIEEVLEGTPVPVGASIEFGRGFFGFGDDGQSRNVLFIALLSLLSVWMIVSALLESVKYPLFVIMAVPYSLIGIMLGTLSNDLAFDRGAIAGSLLCIGVVVNNAILIYHQKQLENGNGIFGLRCWMHVYRKRMRAILITTVTTITGLLPMMLFGANQFWENLAIVVIWGLSVSTLLLLLMTGLRVKNIEH
ncbi:efflux RND transporter permease subunit [Gracilimonas mengyeensis]|uniref:Multidrug efflux pump subunit AcrB n=1 Tax=Gracilimonas mengyeensis TaxID=1302730 RepID=A0A521B5V9_9BACT|nr:efflux RND transporter permease subunit [Gracilimonas mengyeensis]SMO42469.1 Multidrug efflux pump subunit AcrB [Gracilimonas mengyeensis]